MKSVSSYLIAILLIGVVLVSGCIQKQTTKNESTAENKNTTKIASETNTNVFSSKTFGFEVNIPKGWKKEKDWQIGGVSTVNFVNEKYRMSSTGDTSVREAELKSYGAISIIYVKVPVGQYSPQDVRNAQLSWPSSNQIKYENFTKIGGETAWEVIHKDKLDGNDRFWYEVYVSHNQKLYEIGFEVIGYPDKLDAIFGELKNDFNNFTDSIKFID